jgi:hypothetical protein
MEQENVKTNYDTRWSASLIRRFWAKVNKNGPVPSHRPELGPCWVWTASLGSHGYGQLSTVNGPETSHRLSWLLHYGSISPGQCVLHHCDNRACIRPDHLFLGSRGDNLVDMKNKKRSTWGERQWAHKLTESDVQSIRRMYGTGRYLQKALAQLFGVSSPTISDIIRGATWSNLDYAEAPTTSSR